MRKTSYDSYAWLAQAVVLQEWANHSLERAFDTAACAAMSTEQQQEFDGRVITADDVNGEVWVGHPHYSERHCLNVNVKAASTLVFSGD